MKERDGAQKASLQLLIMTKKSRLQEPRVVKVCWVAPPHAPPPPTKTETKHKHVEDRLFLKLAPRSQFVEDLGVLAIVTIQVLARDVHPYSQIPNDICRGQIMPEIVFPDACFMYCN